MTKQLDLFRAEVRRGIGPHLARRMIAVLASNKGWLTRRDFSCYGLNDRQCRLGRECSHGRIIRGQKGYRLLKFATHEEIAGCLRAWQAQIKAEQDEYAVTCRRAHRLLAGERA